jgi:hypothetical protein
MKHVILVVGCLALVGFVSTSCEMLGSSETEGSEAAMGKCPVCEKEMALGAYCAECNAVATNGETFESAEEGKTLAAGTYDEEANAFRFQEEIECPSCGKMVTKGSYCEEHNKYRGLPSVGYCQKCQKPFDAKTGCPTCAEATEEGAST